MIAGELRIRSFSGSREIPSTAVLEGPAVQDFGDEFRTVVDTNALEDDYDLHHLDGQAFPSKRVQDGQGAEALSVEESVGDDVLALALVWCHRRRKLLPVGG